MRSRAYYITRSIVRAIVWTAIAAASVLALQLFIVLIWSLQF